MIPASSFLTRFLQSFGDDEACLLDEYRRVVAENDRMNRLASSAWREACKLPALNDGELKHRALQANFCRSSSGDLSKGQSSAMDSKELLNAGESTHLLLALQDAIDRLQKSSEMIATMATTFVRYRSREAGALVTER